MNPKVSTNQRQGISNEPDWEALRQDFPTLQKHTYMALANKAPLPRQVETAMHEWMADIYDNAGEVSFSMEPIEETRNTVARVFGAPSESIALIKNTSEGINIVAKGLELKEGDNVIISEFEHENNTFPWRYLEGKGVDVRMAEPTEDGCLTLDCYRPLIDRHTKAVSASWVSYGNGYRQDVPSLAALCHDSGAKLVIDAIQAVGILSDPISSLGADIVIAGGHKAQFSLTGAGFMYVNPDIISEITPPYAAKYSFTSNDRFQESPKLAGDSHRFEYGNPNYLGIWVQRRSAEYVESIGLENIEARVREITTYLMDEAEACGLKVLTPKPWQQRAGIVSLDCSMDHEQLVQDLQKKNIFVSYKDGYLRASLHFYNNKNDVDTLIKAIKN
ncbi:MAG: aminotransferase class V-fold PLP-dependent enzyme [Rhodospirillaceae bacterium]